MRILGSLLFLAVATVATATGVAACSSSTSDSPAGGCESNPFSCPAGQTCSAKDSSGAFACITSGSGAKGSTCINTPGMTTCGDGLTCLQIVASGGQCTDYCDSAHACAAGETCTAAGIAGTSTIFHVCNGGTPTTADAGSKDAATANDAATD
jgi:hypothetical protein